MTDLKQVATLASLVDGGMQTVEIGETKLLLLRHGNAVRAFAAECPHAGAPLDQGAICNGRLICPWHKAMFDITDGSLLEPPALEGLTRYPARVDAGLVFASADAIEPAGGAKESIQQDRRVMVVVGAGAAGTAGVSALRAFGFAGRIVLIGDEPGDPFDRTALSKFVLAGKMPPDEVPPLQPELFYAEHRIERVRATVTRIAPDQKQLHLSNGATLAYDAVLLATGGVARPLDVPGGDSGIVHTLRTRADATAILAAIRGKKTRVVIVGGGFIGLEAASALRTQDLQVSVVMPDEIPFEPILGSDIGAALRRLHESKGVVFHAGRSVVSVEANSVTLDNGERLAADLVIAALGIRPATAFAAALSPGEDGSLSTDAGLRVQDGVYAAGDIARFVFGDTPIRVEHWRVAQQQARIAARNMLGGDDRFSQPPFFWTAHYDKRFEVHGHAKSFDAVSIEGDLDKQDFIARVMRDGNLVGLIGCGRDTELAEQALSVPSHG